jgi:hypothetical protein
MTWFAPILVVIGAGHLGAVILDRLTHVRDAVVPISTMRIGRGVELWLSSTNVNAVRYTKPYTSSSTIVQQKVVLAIKKIRNELIPMPR